MAGMVRQLGFPEVVDDVDVPVTSRVFAQVRVVLEENPELRGRVGAVVATVWDQFHGLGKLIESGETDAVLAIIAGEWPHTPNYKTVSRNYHRVCEQYPHLAAPPQKAGT